MSASVKENYQDVATARAYDKERFSSFVGRTFDRLEQRAIAKAVCPIIANVPQPRVLDVPCGTGRITKLLLNLGLGVTGGDISVQMLEVAGEKCNQFGDRVSFRRLDLDALDLPNDSFDIVTCIRLFHHLDTDARRRVLCELARVSSQFVMVNVSLSTPYYRFRRRAKRLFRQGISATSSTWDAIRHESAAAGLTLIAHRYVLPFVSEDVVLLFRKH